MWFEQYIGKPWAEIPNPPHSFTCGELVRHIFKDRLNISIKPIEADGRSLKQCIIQLQLPESYGFYPFTGSPQPFDIVYVLRRIRRDHVALAVKTPQGLYFLHCLQERGVVLESEFEMQASTTSNFMEWRRHEAITRELVQCHA